ncbi:hypothetical protein GF380_02900 [Candidatus Uhrbacteria bacterium]|nr:hypothetical protein [Candidatus Uhrbacteria bacterium]
MVGCVSAYRSPGFLFFLTGTYGLFGFENFFVQALIQNIIAVIVVYAVYRLGFEITKDRRVGWLAGLMIALHPYTFYHYTQYYHTMISSLLIVLLMLVLLKLERTKRWKWAFWGGVLIAALAYIQGTILPATVFLSLWLFIRWWPDWKRSIGAIALMAVVSAGLIAPWTLRNYAAFHAFVPLTTDLGHALAKANHENNYLLTKLGYPQETATNIRITDEAHPLQVRYEMRPEVREDIELHGTFQQSYLYETWHPLEPGLRGTCEEQREFSEPAFNTYWSGKAKSWIIKSWPDVIQLQAQKVAQFWTPKLQPSKRYGASWSFGHTGIIAWLATWSLAAWVLMIEILAMIGLWFAGKKRLLGRIAPLLIVMAVYTLMHSFFAGYTKYRIPLDNLLAVIAAVSMISIWDLLRWIRK